MKELCEIYSSIQTTHFQCWRIKKNELPDKMEELVEFIEVIKSARVLVRMLSRTSTQHVLLKKIDKNHIFDKYLSRASWTSASMVLVLLSAIPQVVAVAIRSAAVMSRPLPLTMAACSPLSPAQGVRS